MLNGPFNALAPWIKSMPKDWNKPVAELRVIRMTTRRMIWKAVFLLAGKTMKKMGRELSGRSTARPMCLKYEPENDVKGSSEKMVESPRHAWKTKSEMKKGVPSMVKRSGFR